MVERLTEMPKPVEDGFPYDVETDSLADSLGLRLPNRSLIMLQGEVGSGKSLVSQRFVHGLLHNDVKVLVITTELTTRGWIEQMESIGYGVTTAMTNQVIPGVGSTSLFNGYLKGIITGVSTDSTNSNSTVTVKITSRVSSSGEETPINYAEGDGASSFSTLDLK